MIHNSGALLLDGSDRVFLDAYLYPETDEQGTLYLNFDIFFFLIMMLRIRKFHCIFDLFLLFFLIEYFDDNLKIAYPSLWTIMMQMTPVILKTMETT